MVIEFQRSTIHHPNITLAIRSSDSCNAGTLFYFILFYFIFFFLISCQCYDLLLSYHRETKPTQLEHYFQISTT